MELLAKAGRSCGIGWNTYMRQVAMQHARRTIREDQLAELDARAQEERVPAKVKAEPPLFKRPRRETHYHDGDTHDGSAQE